MAPLRYGGLPSGPWARIIPVTVPGQYQCSAVREPADLAKICSFGRTGVLESFPSYDS